MCGICGELRLDGNASGPDTIESMLRALRRRGPDHEGSYFSAALGLGHRRLAVIDLSEQANQPMVDAAAGTVIVFNGTIYNYPQLRRQLIGLGHTFRSTGDTEVILKAYAQWGRSSVSKLSGMFAFAIWDAGRQELFLARDRLGIKPLYYTQGKEFFRFASTSQALLGAGGVDTELDRAGLHHFLSLHGVVPAPGTILQGLKKLPPGHTMRVQAAGNSMVERYWQLNADRVDADKGEQEWQHDIQAALQLAVERRLRIADVPVGVLLSGGLDSSLLVGLLNQAGVREIQTYSAGFEDQPEERGNEFEYSDAVAGHFATRHHKFYIDNRKVLARLPEAVEHMTEPMVGQDAIAFYLLAEQVSQHVSVVQSGQGADEVFGGYFWYPRMQAESSFGVESFARHYFDRSHAEMQDTLHQDLVSDDFTSDSVRQLLHEANTDDFIRAVLHMDVTTLMVDDPVKRVDNMTMAHGLEARVPFLDHELVELAMQLPVRYKLAHGGKHILKNIARGLLPSKVIDREKGYFPVPALKYVRSEFMEFMRGILHSDACMQRGLFQRRYVDTLLANPERYLTPLKGSKLWHLALLEFWLQRNVDRCLAS
ncbi:MAG: N-acetylglutaminylglutamine amidotransferase [Gammaproteobacteria bacterium]|nr:N-acetylglutaminylglutamine amidotransferase [Gammaproteobacteria bacterium]